jgi:NAD(P)-dependent dehydrogenase (short-subunit alcohol dehydrogenase family)
VFARQVKVGKLSARERLDGMTVLVDGASAGLGFAIAVRMASRGARVVMACRSGIPEKGEKVKKLSGNPNVQMVHVDFADLRSIENLVKDLRANYPPFDIVISNAAMVPRKSRQTPQGLEEMFMVNYLSKFIFINGLIRQGCLNYDGKSRPRIVFVSSESHRHPQAFDWNGFGVVKDYGMNKTVEHYGYYKLLLTTFAVELSRRLNREGEKPVSVFSLCPGPVNSSIAREAPGIVQPLMKLVFAIFFASPAKASEPVEFLAVSHALEGKNFDYLFKMSRKAVDEKAAGEDNGKKLWDLSEQLIRKIS